MKIAPIFTSAFPEEDAVLFAMEYAGERYNGLHILDYLFNQWTDALFLREYFRYRLAALSSPFWNGLSVSDAARQVRREADDFFKELSDIESVEGNKRIERLHDLFKLLHQEERGVGPFAYKAKPWEDRYRPMLRLYGLKLKDGSMIITGGGIKLTRSMQEDPELEAELKRIEAVKAFLKHNGIEYLDDYFTT